MIPIYIGIVLLQLLVFFVKTDLFKWRRRSSLVIIFLSLTMGIFLSTALPVLTFRTAGTHNVSIQDFQIVDVTRKEFFSQDEEDNRDFSLRVYYPTSSKKSANTSYFLDWEAIRPTFDKKLGWPDFMLNYLRLFSLEASQGKEIREGEYPIVFYSHGLANNYTEASGRLLKIASKGYVVAALNHSYSSDFARLKSGKIVNYAHDSFLGKPIRQVDSLKTIIAQQWVDDVKSTIEYLKESKIAKSIDFSKICLIGFSAGGTMALMGAEQIENVRLVINLDGTPRGLKNYQNFPVPVLMMYSEKESFTDSQLKAWRVSREQIEAPQQLIDSRTAEILKGAPKKSKAKRINGIKHTNFIEYPLISPFSHYLGIGGEVDSKEFYDTLNSEIFMFFDENLKDSRQVMHK